MNRQMRRRQEREMKKMEKQADEVAQRGINVVVAVPCQSDVKAYFCYDLAQMMAYTATRYSVPGVIDNMALAMQVGTYVHTARMALAAAAMQQEMDYVLFLDSDMRFPPDTLARLLARNLPMVGCNYVSRKYPVRYIGVEKVADPESEEKGTLLTTARDSTGVEECDALGFGVMLIRRDVFEALPDPREQPWWWYEWMPKHNSQIGEDVYFCRLVREAGVPIHVDHDLSKQIKHLGDEQFSLEHVWAQDKLQQQLKEVEDAASDDVRDPPDGGAGDPKPVGRSDSGGGAGVDPEGGAEAAEGHEGETPSGPESILSLVGGDSPSE